MRSDDYCRDEDVFASDDLCDDEIEDYSPDYCHPSTTSEIRDSLFDEAARLVVRYQQASTSFLQRKLNISYNRASRILDQLVVAGFIAPQQRLGSRKVLIVKLDETKEDNVAQCPGQRSYETGIERRNEQRSEENPSSIAFPQKNPRASDKPQYADSVNAMNGCFKWVINVFVYSFLIVLTMCLSPLIIFVLLIWWIVAWVLGLLYPGKEFMPLGKVWNSSKQWTYEKLGIDLEQVLGGAVLAMIFSAIIGLLTNIFSRDR